MASFHHNYELTHLGLVTPYGIGDLGQVLTISDGQIRNQNQLSMENEEKSLYDE